MTVGIICEYNPLHTGHQKQLRRIREELGGDCAIVCAMSGNFVQRGMPAVLDKSLRAEAAVRCGADLVLELPVTTALSSAEGFAAGGVAALSPLCTHLCFGAETANKEELTATAEMLLREDFSRLLKEALGTGLSFPAARARALEKMGGNSHLLETPNNILAVEYCKAIIVQESTMKILPIERKGDYHATLPEEENPSATAVRRLMLAGQDWHRFVPEAAWPVFDQAPLHSLAAGERAVLARLRTMTEEEWEALPYGSEGLWRKLMHAARSEPTLEDILQAAKSKRYTRTRLDRMVMCAFLGITQQMLQSEAPYIRVLAFNDRGRGLLSSVKKCGQYRNAGETVPHPYQALENRCGDLYGLFCTDAPEPPGTEARRRVFYSKKEGGNPLCQN